MGLGLNRESSSGGELFWGYAFARFGHKEESISPIVETKPETSSLYPEDSMF
jgi:hypothetical protein